jgi:5-bromo-4-chloroindolyl phosphate hydrolysis protein
MNTPWFDPETGFFTLDENILERPSFKRILADEVVTDEEVREQADRTVALLKELDSKLNDDLRPLVTDTLCELMVLSAVERYAELKIRTDLR